MTRILGAENALLLRTLLGETSPLLPFAEAVILHLSSPPAQLGSPDLVIGRVAGILNEALEGSTATARRQMRSNPEVLASFFQNADLLEHHTPEAAAIGRLVMESLSNDWPSEA